VGVRLALRGHQVDLLSPGKAAAVVRAIAPNINKIDLPDRTGLARYLDKSASSYDCWLLLGPWCWEVAAPCRLAWDRVFLVADDTRTARVGHGALRHLSSIRLLSPDAGGLRAARVFWGRARWEKVIGWGVDVPEVLPRGGRRGLGLLGTRDWQRTVTEAIGQELVVPLDRAGMVVIASRREYDLLEVMGRGAVALVPEEWDDGKLVCLQSRGGLYFASLDELGREVRRLASDAQLLESMSVAAWRFALQQGSWDAVADAVETAARNVQPGYPLVYIVIINWNGKRHLAACLGSLRRLDYPNFKVLIVDNGSTDGSVEFLRVHFPEVEVVPVGRNLGFAEGNNVGMRLALRKGARCLALLNNDTEIDRRWLSRLVQRAKSSDSIGIVGSKMMMFRERRVLNSAGSSMNRCGFGWDEGIFTLDGPAWSKPRYCLCVTAGAMLVKREVLEQVGLFDPGYFAYYEDNDLCLRARNAGFKIAYEPGAIVFHKLSGTSGEASQWKTFLMERSRYRLVLKKYPGRVFRDLLPTLLRYDLREVKGWLNAREYPRVRAQFQAFLAALAMLPGILARRRAEGPLREDVWSEVENELGRPIIRKECAHLGSMRLMGRLIPRGRVLMGVNDDFLEGVWPKVMRDFPRYRLLEGTLGCRMPVCVEGPAALQLHLYGEPGQDCSIAVSVGGRDLDERTVHPGWNTYVWRAGTDLRTPEVSLRARGKVRINEIVLGTPDPARVRAS
jgi:GT2 family glycosyltransferase